MRANFLSKYIYILLGLVLFYVGCIAPKDTVTSRGMQNLTARYNIIYNANLVLQESERNIEKAHIDNFAGILSVYKEPTESISASENTNLDSVIKKADLIIDEKLHSNYVDDAYLLIAKSNYLKSKFFIAVEYFNYLYDNYPLEKDLRQESLIWKARAQLQLDDTAEASKTIDSALKYVETSEKNIDDVYATYAQYLIISKRNKDAILVLQKAIDAKSTKQAKLRWKYILAQLQAENKQYADAYRNFSTVVKSNAPFEMAFNANLNRIRIEEEQSGAKTDRITRLKSLLRDDKNKDFNDQIYYHIGNIYFEDNQLTEAIKNYNTSIKTSTNNQDQKGLSYLKLADIYFNNRDYVNAKAYYDSTLSTLSSKYPGYELTRKKSSNLELLASRYRTISREDTLQALARLSESERETRIAELVRIQSQHAIAQVNQQTPVNNLLAGIDNPSTLKPAEGKFYFNNTSAISQGFSDFKRRWGNRRLEDNWRRNAKTAAESTITMNADPDATIGASTGAGSVAANPEAIRENFLKNLPLTEPLMLQSNQKIAEAYYDIANFYKDELKDERIAIQTFEELLQRVSESTYTLPVYYNLYRLYQPFNAEKSSFYKNLILSKYPDSPFAKVINNPDYSRDSDEKEQAMNTEYNTIFDLYTNRKYNEVFPAIQKFEQRYSNNKLSPQLAYLNALTIGHTQKLPAFENVLNQLVTAYPADPLVTPLVKQHLQYIKDNRPQMIGRATALLDFDPNSLFVEEPVAQVQNIPQGNNISQPVNNTVIEPDKAVSQPDQKAVNQPQEKSTAPAKAEENPDAPTASNVKAVKSPFNLPGAAEYYFVINITNPNTSLSSSRFGVGQFNRTHYSGMPLKHQLQDVNNENQLVYIGSFNTYEDVKAYETAILPLLKDIMKVSPENYNSFIITKEGLDKLKNREIINSYIEFYKNSN